MTSLARVPRPFSQDPFVGRSGELATLRNSLEPSTPPRVINVQGPPGVGKTALLREFARLSSQAHWTPMWLDAETTALGQLESHLAADKEAAAPWPPDPRSVVIVDDFDVLWPSQPWTADEFVRRLSTSAVLVLASESALTWLVSTAPGVARFLALGPLGERDCLELLERLGVPKASRPLVAEFAAGYPLAIRLAAAAIESDPTAVWGDLAPGLAARLLAALVPEFPDTYARRALEASSVVDGLTEPLLAAMLESSETHEAFQWLRQRPFVRLDALGVSPVRFARNIIELELRWRDPDEYERMRRRARRYYLKRIPLVSRDEQEISVANLLAQARRSHITARFTLPSTESADLVGSFSSIFAHHFAPEDRKPLRAIVHHLQGPRSARLAEYWMARQPDGVTVWRDDAGQVVGLALVVSSERLSEDDLAEDPVIRRFAEYIDATAPLRDDEVFRFVRFWMHRSEHQRQLVMARRIFARIGTDYFSEPRLAVVAWAIADDGFGNETFPANSFGRFPASTFTEGGRTYSVYGHDWRAQPLWDWLRRTQRNFAGFSEPQPQPTLASFAHEEFAMHVRSALRDVRQPIALAGNALLRSKIVASRTPPGAPLTERVQALQAAVREVMDELAGSGRTQKLHAALRLQYLEPVGSQQDAARVLDIPISTFRRHVSLGASRIADLLWLQETGRGA